MKTRTLFAVAVIATSLSLSQAVYASPANIQSPLHAMFGKEKTVKLSLRNGSDSSIDVKVGEELMTLTAGQSVSLNLPIGTRIVANSDTSTVKAGTLITQISKELSGAVLTLK